ERWLRAHAERVCQCGEGRSLRQGGIGYRLCEAVTPCFFKPRRNVGRRPDNPAREAVRIAARILYGNLARTGRDLRSIPVGYSGVATLGHAWTHVHGRGGPAAR